MSFRRNLLAFAMLLALLSLAFPILSSLLSDWFGNNPPRALPSPAQPTTIPTVVAQATASATPTASLTATTTPSPTATWTPTATPTPTATWTPTATFTPTPRPRVFLLPFVQVFAMGQAQPANSAQVLLYEGGNDVFQVLETQGALARLQVVGDSFNFWTANGNVSPTLPLAAQYDYSVRGKLGKLIGGSVFACAHNDRPTLAFGACVQLSNVSTVTLIANITASGSALYLAQINNVQYIIPANVVTVSP